MNEKPRPAEQPEFNQLLEEPFTYGIFGSLIDPDDKSKKCFSGLFKLNLSDQTIEGSLIDPLFDEGLVSRIKGKMDDRILEFASSSQVIPLEIFKYFFYLDEKEWVKDKCLYSWRGFYGKKDNVNEKEQIIARASCITINTAETHR